MLKKQRGKVLLKVNNAIKEENRVLDEKERKIQENIRAMGLCPMGYKWHREGDGWRCGGGSHYLTQEQIESYMQTQI